MSEISDEELKKLFKELKALDEVPQDVAARMNATIDRLSAAEKKEKEFAIGYYLMGSSGKRHTGFWIGSSSQSRFISNQSITFNKYLLISSKER